MTDKTTSALEEIFRLEGKTVVITGTTGFFGRMMAETFLSVGCKVVALGRTEKVRELADHLSSQYPAAMTGHVVDFYDRPKLRRTLEQVMAANKTIDVLINNAYDFSVGTGFNHPSGRLETLSEDQFFRGAESGIYWPFLTTQIIGQQMVKQGYGSIINICSMYAIVAPDARLYEQTSAFNPATYSLAKAALLALTRYVASFWGQHNVRCNAILPGSFPNLGGDSYNSPQDTDFIRRLEAKTVLGRVGQPADLAGALLLLASEASGYITGQAIIIDGGWTTI